MMFFFNSWEKDDFIFLIVIGKKPFKNNRLIYKSDDVSILYSFSSPTSFFFFFFRFEFIFCYLFHSLLCLS
ncbi:uncharacterized protein BX664DRAFT_355496 [Halteromyces radiatus]|uniref:uncharacterized protein n=1 Tax=Halteromyces radiatus TaxID=101107 RepID=UPI00221FB388|nr:uncharacterized protein BX664DRAFT_355496 [Halteromyces radiatus]KAI8100156.1 hypothetical protein BX664DRAFT_355496 [Halteromyces radiatus]